MDNAENEASSLQAICQGISHTRANELLEAANGSLERAVDIFFHQQRDHSTSVCSSQAAAAQNEIFDDPKTPPRTRRNTPSEPTSTSKKRIPSPSKQNQLSSSPSRGGRKQARLDSFFAGHRPASSPSTKIKEEDDDSINITGTIPAGQSILSPYTIEDDGFSEKTAPVAMKPIKSESKILVHPRKAIGLPQAADQQHDILFDRLTDSLQQLASTTKRLVKLDLLKELIRHIIQQPYHHADKSKTLTCALKLCLGFRGGSDQAALEIGGSALSKALQTILGASRMQLSKGYRKYGDMGDTAASLFQKQTFFVSATASKSLTITQVYESFENIVAADGRDAKQHIVLQLLRACNSKTEIRFLVRLLIGNMRIGANLKTILAALAMAVVPVDTENTKPAIELIQKTHDICPNLGSIVDALLKGGLQQMKRDCGIQLLTPIAPMLAHPIQSLDQVAKLMNSEDGEEKSMIMEWKYDGVRCQAHYDGTTVKLFSRHMLETTAQYPDAAKACLAAALLPLAGETRNAVTSFILDAEIVGIEGESDNVRLLPFQDLSRRKKHDDGKGIRVKVFVFDLMYLNGTSHIDTALEERQKLLLENFLETEDFAYVSSQTLPAFDEARIKIFLEEAVHHGAEGLMMKVLGNSPTKCKNQMSSDPEIGFTTSSSPYEAGTRSRNWLKVKRDYVAGYIDTIDVVPIGAWYGSGRKAQKSFLSPVLLAVYDEDEDVYRSISRCMSFTDAMYDAMREFYFRGSPYPAEIGIDGGESVAVLAPKSDFERIEEEGNGEDDSSEKEEGDMVGTDKRQLACETGDGEAVGVNCFPSRPSSAYVVTNESPPIWFKPMEVFEVSFADMSLSRQHTAGAGLVEDSDGRGVALRFPRFKRRRPDKRPEQATTSLQIAQMFAQQPKQRGNTARNN